MHTPEANEAMRWLAEQGVTPLPTGRWQQSHNDLAHEWAAALFDDDRLTPEQRLRAGFGLLDLLEEYWVTVELRWFITDRANPSLTAAFWAAFRQRLEAPEASEQLQYSLWVDWFEDQASSGTAFAAVLGDDVRSRSDLRPLATGPLHRRAARVLEHSGPVRWAEKRDVYEAVAAVPELHHALFKGLLAGHHDVYGELNSPTALVLLDRLDLPPETEHLAALRAVLRTRAQR